jgi:hypothetical protein
LTIEIVPNLSNKEPSDKLNSMLVDLENNTKAIFDSIEEIRTEARSEGFEDFETDLLLKPLKPYLDRGMGRDRAKYILRYKCCWKKLNFLTKNLGTFPKIDDNNVPKIPAPDYNIVFPDQVFDKATQEQKKEPSPFEEFKQQEPDYGTEELKLQLENTRSNLDQTIEDKKQLEEKYKQLEAKTRVSPSNSIPAVQGNNLRIKVVVAQIFCEVLALKGSKMIYANILIDLTQNKYVRLEPL